MATSEQLTEVHIVGFPLQIHKAVAEHFDELKREFALLRFKENRTDSTPSRLLTVIDQLSDRYRGFSTTPNEVRDEAFRRGDETVDLAYSVPAGVKDACIELEQLLDEADQFCKTGEHLLTLAAPPEVVDFRRWFLQEFVRQIEGEEPMSWSEYRTASRA
jgi:hypothetical protein